MVRYLYSITQKSSRLFRHAFTHVIYRLLFIQYCSVRLLITYLMLVTFSTTVLVYHQSNKPDHSHVPIHEEVIQCHFPQLSLYNDELVFPISKTVQPKCHSWFQPIVIENYAIRLVIPNLVCTAMFHLFRGDQRAQIVPVSLIYNFDVILLSDHFIVQCEDPKKEKFYPKLSFASIHHDPIVRQRLANVSKDEHQDDFNVLVLGVDSISRLQFQRMLPQTYNYLTQNLNAIILKGYNILGDGTPQQLVPMLTGFKEMELPSTLIRDRNASNMDIYPFIWKHYRQQGYVTGYAEDRIEYGIWTLRLKGFKQTPTDHYLVPFYHMDAVRSLLYRKETHCIGNQTTFDLFLSYIEQFWSAYPRDKKFFFAFFKQYTHDGYADGPLLDTSLMTFLERFYRNDQHQKTILMLMADHGARFSATRRTSQGKLEERLPFFSFVFPKLFREKYPKAIEILEKNIPRLTTPFDIHSTLLSLINMRNVDPMKTHSVEQRNISLFNLIPAQRTCDHLKVEAHWCSCLQWNTININAPEVQLAVKHIIEFINQQLRTVKDKLCRPIELTKVHNAQVYQPNRALLRFSKSADIDGRIPKYGDLKANITFYQITFETKPNDAIYEATTQYSSKSATFNTGLDHISRLNAYKLSAECIEKSYSHLRKFCDCIR